MSNELSELPHVISFRCVFSVFTSWPLLMEYRWGWSNPAGEVRGQWMSDWGGGEGVSRQVEGLSGIIARCCRTRPPAPLCRRRRIQTVPLSSWRWRCGAGRKYSPGPGRWLGCRSCRENLSRKHITGMSEIQQNTVDLGKKKRIKKVEGNRWFQMWVHRCWMMLHTAGGSS